jgi:hypothetical protein
MKKFIVFGVLALCSISLFAQELVIFRDNRSLEVRNHREEKDWTYLTIGSGQMAVRTADILKIVKENVTASPRPVSASEHAAPAHTPPPVPTRAPVYMRPPRPGVPSRYPTVKRPPPTFQPPPDEQKEQVTKEEDAEEEDMDEGADDEEEEAEPKKPPQGMIPSPAPRRLTVPLQTSPKTRGR